MGEIDTKSIESVQAALSLFGEKADLRKHRSSSSGSSGDAESEKEELEKEVATYKVQLEAKESAYMQLLLKLQQYEEKVDDLSALLMKLQRERDQCMDECREAQTHVDELQIKVKEMSDELSETIKAHDQQLTVAVSELKSTQARLLSLETELAAEREMKIKAISEAETMENAAAVEKEELKEEIVRLEMAAVEAEEEKNAALQHKNKQIQELEDQLEEKFDVIRSLQIDREQANKQAKEDETDEFSFTVEEPCLEKILSFDHKKYKITIPLEEYESLVNKEEVEVLKKELESAMAKAGEFRTRAEQAMSRAHSAEKAKEMVEVQLRSWKEQKQRRKAAMAALREESASRGFNPPTMHDSRALTHPPLGKVLNMKF